MDLGLRDKRAIITGATKGIGRQILEILIAEGCNVATCSRSIEDVEMTKEKVSTSKAKVYGDVCDVRDKDEYAAWIDKVVEEMDGVDIFIPIVSAGGGMDSEKNLTLAILNYSDGWMSISGQHEEILIVRANCTVESIDTVDLGMPIGLDDNITAFINYVSVKLQPGDGVVLYTDGIPEAYNLHRKQYGMPRLRQIIAQNWKGTAEDVKRAIINDVKGGIGNQKVFDDITLLVLKQQ